MTAAGPFSSAATSGFGPLYLLVLGVLALILIGLLALIAMEVRRRNAVRKRKALRAESKNAAPAEPEVPRPILKLLKHRCRIDGEMFVHVFDVELLTEAAPSRVTVEAEATNTVAISMGAAGEKFDGQENSGGALPIVTIDAPPKTFQINVWSRNGVQVPEIAARVE